MKAFEKWYNEDISDEQYEAECGGDNDEVSDEEFIERTQATCWRAALEWTKKEMLNYPVSGHTSSHDRSNMLKIIDKELEGGK